MPHFKHKTGQISGKISGMKNFVFTCLGLIGLSAAAGAAMLSSHAALAAGPKLPDYLVRAHAVTATATSNLIPVALTSADTVLEIQSDRAVPDTGNAPVQVAALQTSDDPYASVTQTSDASDTTGFVSSRESTIQTVGLAPHRTLRPLARPAVPVTTASTSDDIAPRINDGEVADAVTSPAPQPRRVAALTTPRTDTRATVLQRVFRAETGPVRRTSATNPTPNYFHGVFR